MPTDPQTVGQYDAGDLVEVLQEVEDIIGNTQFNDLIWAGDMNWHVERNSHFSNIMKNFVEKMELVSLWSHYDVDYTHIHTDNKSVTTLDHFLISPRLLSSVCAAGAILRGDNLSRHSPIFVKLNLGCLPIKSSLSHKTPINC